MKDDTAAGMVMSPSLGEYCFTYAIYVDCKRCQRDATIGSIRGTNEPILKCNHCGWSETMKGKDYQSVIDTIKRQIASVG